MKTAGKPKGLVEFIIDAIEEAAPGRGAAIYWLGFDRWQEYSAQRLREAAERELIKTAPLLAEARKRRP